MKSFDKTESINIEDIDIAKLKSNNSEKEEKKSFEDEMIDFLSEDDEPIEKIVSSAEESNNENPEFQNEDIKDEQLTMEHSDEAMQPDDDIEQLNEKMVELKDTPVNHLEENKIDDSDLSDIVKNDFNLNGKFEAYSAGIFAQDGDGPLFNAVEAMREYDIDIKNYRSTSLKSSNIRDMDLILCAQASNKNVLLNICPDLKDKTFTLKEFINDNINLDIIEPKGYDIAIYRTCASEIQDCVYKLIKKLKESEEL